MRCCTQPLDIFFLTTQKKYSQSSFGMSRNVDICFSKIDNWFPTATTSKFSCKLCMPNSYYVLVFLLIKLYTKI